MNKKAILPTVIDLLQRTENSLHKIKLLVKKLESGENDIDQSELDDMILGIGGLNKPLENDTETIVEGIFDGNFMLGSDDKKYPVPLNYSSKSKIIQGDTLKLRISADGSMIYKVIGQVNRKTIKGLITKNDEGKYVALGDDDKIYNLNQAAVSFFHGKVSDDGVLIINADKKCDYAALETIINQS